ncbi:MAG TPA: hypothetical protein VLH38_03360 [Patescibacteria group bacterium]|nr:hypothetical protein [Patescibacteria group bacterium]
MSLNVTLRSAAGESHYQLDIAAGFTRALELLPSIKQWNHWRLVVNEYPYDIAFGVHDLLVVKRAGVAERWELNDAEKAELEQILRDFVYPVYSLTFENSPSKRSAPHQYHLHVVRYHAKREEMHL